MTFMRNELNEWLELFGPKGRLYKQNCLEEG